ncbi:MAG: ATP--guanido phosphotransferase [Lachnospiraceae bacterium]|nr:ATP--guanido phosphotransferase [Lachnospiraceae bacterium]
MNWYEDPNVGNEIFVAARIRLTRNLRDYAFPNKLSNDDAEELIAKLRDKMDGWKTPTGETWSFLRLDRMSALQKNALREHRVINETLSQRVRPSGLYMSADEGVSVALMGDDHIRIQVLSPEVTLDRLWNICTKIDDAINEHFNYAFHDRYGYLTAFPTNMGTGLRVSVILHLPYLSASPQFHKLVNEVARFGVGVRNAFGEGEEKAGRLFEVYNQNTLGVSEEEIVALVYRLASHLAVNEKQAREQRYTPVMREDEAAKAYGRLKYARLLSVRDAMASLSSLRAGLGEELITLSGPLNVFGLMVNCCPAALALKTMNYNNTDNLGADRAEFVRAMLPELL